MGTLYTNARIIDGTGRSPFMGHVLVDETMIAAVAAADAPRPGNGHAVVDLGRRTLMPGVIDCHVHLSLDGVPDPLGEAAADPDALAVLRMTRNAERTLAAGITTVRDAGAKNHIDLAFRQGVKEGLHGRAPRILCSGRPITMTGGHCWQIGRQADGVDDVRRAAREQIKAGADWIKVMATGGILTQGTEPGSAQLGADEIRSAVEEAEKAGRRVAVHAHGAEGIKDAIRAGVTSIEHGYFLDDEGIALMGERGTWLVPTAAAVKLVVRQGTAGGIPCAAVRKAASAADVQVSTCRKAWQAGVRLAMGTDAGTPYNRHGDNMQELEAMTEIGLSPIEAIVMATRGSAELLALDSRLGTLEAGKVADMIVVDGDPLADIGVLKDPARIEMVIQAGEVVARHGEVLRD